MKLKELVPRSAVDLIREERQVQRRLHGYTDEHDDKHVHGELRDAAVCYAFGEQVFGGWPFDQASWKPSADQVRNLVKAGALIAAEIDRLRRLPAKPAVVNVKV